MKRKKKLCGKYDHDWYEICKCKDAVIGHPCEFYPEGCNTCLTRFECYTKDSDTYATRTSAVFYACSKCPAIKAVGTISEWKTRKLAEDGDEFQITDSRKYWFKGMDEKIAQKLHDKWKDE